jgi:hypothetical protein
MPSSISSSERTSPWRWTTALAMASVVAIAIVGAMETHWRALGYQPNIRDSSELWSIERDRVYAEKKTPLVLLGASRIEFAIDMHLLSQLLPNYQPVMLAQNGHYPLAALRDLASDEDFHGVVLCDIESRGLYKMYTDMQQPLVDYYHRQWSPSWHVHRLLLNLWQAHFDVADPQLGVVAAARRWIDGSAPQPPDYFRFHTDRSGNIDYTKTDVEAAKKHFEQLVANTKDIRALVPPDEWFADLHDVYAWTQQIQARGGKVIFYQSPTSGEVRRTDLIAHPRAQYWDRFAANSPAPAIDAEDDPILSAFHEPDDSHMDFRDKAAYTKALVEALQKRGLIERE